MNLPFTLQFYCKKHGRHADHTVRFLSYSVDTKLVTFTAFCNQCLEDAELQGDKFFNGWTSTMFLSEWLSVMPEEDLPSAN